MLHSPTPSPTSLIAVVTTVATAEQAATLARGAVELQLAACVHEEAITSTYRWDGAVQREPEIRLLYKTTVERSGALVQWLNAQHPYELPGIFAFPVADATPGYAAWVHAMVSP